MWKEEIKEKIKEVLGKDGYFLGNHEIAEILHELAEEYDD